ncbi:MAG: glycosyltransferase involved in cell wall biosynthesis [Urechidicola sp.]
MNRIVILTYTFPPSPAIGGRRWAKFAKYLDRAGHDVFVLASDLDKDESSPWSEDIEVLISKSKVEYLKNGYPEVLNSYPEKLYDKLKYRMALSMVKKKVKGNYYDRSSFWQKELFTRLKEKLDEGYDTVIATGAPFQYLYYLTETISRYPKVKFIADIRDPWANNKTAYGFESLSEKRQIEVLDFEEKVMNRFDHVVTVYDATTKYFAGVSQKKAKFHTIPNGYDQEDFDNLDLPVKTKSEKINFVLTGSLYNHALNVFTSFIESLKELKNKHPKVFGSLEFNFFGRTNRLYDSYFHDEDLKDTLFHHGMIPIDQVFLNIQKADVCLLFLTDDMNYSKSTKFFEYMAQRRKIAVFSTLGETGKEVSQKNIGYSMNPGEMVKQFIQIYEDHQNDNLKISEDFDQTVYEVKGILKDYLKIIESEKE